MAKTVDLNSDLGEGYGAWRAGDDEAMLAIVTSANIACGVHAGDPEIMAKSFAVAHKNGVAVGAHPGYADLWGFGRRRIPCSAGEVERLVAYQIGAAAGLAAYAGHAITYVKAHGALANVASEEPDIARALARAVRGVDRNLALLAIALTEQGRAGEAAGLTVYQEVFADRGYTETGQLVSRKEPGAMLTDADAAAARALAMVQEGAIITTSGARLPTAVDSICVHGDSGHAVGMARRLREVLQQAGVVLRPFTAR